MKIEGKNYPIPEINVKTIKELEEYGIYLTFGETPKKVLTIITAFMCVSAGITPEQANEVVEKHVLAGGTIDEWLGDILKAIEASDFVKHIADKPKSKNPLLRFRFNGSDLK